MLKLREPDRVLLNIPKSRLVNDPEQGMLTQVRFGLDEARVLRNLGIAAPSPIRYFYDFPIKPPFKPFDHQVTTSEFFTLYNRSICLNDMGTGKTLSALWSFDYMKSLGIIQRAIVVCPKSTLFSVWEDEIRNHFLSRLKVNVVYGDRKRRQKILNDPADIYIINHDGLKVVEKELRGRTDINLWIIDEAGAFRNPASKRHALLASLVRGTDWMWLMTGTPCPEAPTDAWGLAKLMHGNRVRPAYFTAFRDQTMLQLTQYKWVPKPDAYTQAYAIMQPGIRFKKEDCIDLPPVSFVSLTCGLTPEQQAAYRSMITTMATEIRGVTITAANAAVKMTKLLQICVGSLYDEFGASHRVDTKERLQLCEQVVEQSAHKVIVFVPFTQALDAVAAHLAKRWTVAKVDGRTSDTQRKKIFSDFQQQVEPRIIVAHPGTTAHGLTLTEADTTVWYAPISSLEVFEQANNRMNRPGQTRNMTVATIAATKLEENIYRALRSKKDVQGSVLNLFLGELGLQ